MKLDAATSPRAAATLLVPGIAHVILEVTDNGTPNLTSYRRVILRSSGDGSDANAARRPRRRRPSGLRGELNPAGASR